MLVLGLTGSVAMGKTTVAGMFARQGVPVFDADATVHELYRGGAVAPVEAAFPGSTVFGEIDRDRLRKRVLGNEPAMRKLEAIVHPLVSEARMTFLQACLANGSRRVVLDVPLLFEVGSDREVDAVIVVSTTAENQIRRLMAREGMTPERAEAMRARQMPDTEKRKRGHFLVDTSESLAETELQVLGILKATAGMAAAF